tara:strand:- start:425 stop:976 length:552 start_codon:yes stop_codon:yes gene_type:complete
MNDQNSQDDYFAETLILKDSDGNQLFCALEELVNIEGEEYALLSPIDTPVCLFKINEKDELEFIEEVDKDENILKNAEAVLQEHDLKLIRSAYTLTVSGELEEPENEEFIEDDLEENNLDDDAEEFNLLVSFNVLNDEYGLYIPIEPTFILSRLKDKGAILIEGSEFARIKPLVESELDERYS